MNITWRNVFEGVVILLFLLAMMTLIGLAG